MSRRLPEIKRWKQEKKYRLKKEKKPLRPCILRNCKMFLLPPVKCVSLEWTQNQNSGLLWPNVQSKEEQKLQGMTPGVSISGNSGQPGANQSIRIRGMGSRWLRTCSFSASGILFQLFIFFSAYISLSDKVEHSSSSFVK